MKDARIVVKGRCDATVAIDGHDIASAVRSFSLRHQAGQGVPSLELDLLVVPFEFEGKVQVRIKPETLDLLIRLGWTPPAAADRA